MVALGGGAFSHERGTPVFDQVLRSSDRVFGSGDVWFRRRSDPHNPTAHLERILLSGVHEDGQNHYCKTIPHIILR
jgi:hypothetical protein